MSDAPLPRCPTCVRHMTLHCVDSHTCDLVECQHCRIYSTRDGRLTAALPPR